MGKIYFGDAENKKKMNELKENSTILQRISPKAILAITKNIIPQLKDKIDNLISKASNLDKVFLKRSIAALLLAGTILTASGCSQENHREPSDGELDNTSSTVQNEEEKRLQYISLKFKEAKEYIIKELGYDSDEVNIASGRDGWYLVEEGKEPLYTDAGKISNGAKIRDESGKVVKIPLEYKEILDEMSELLNFYRSIGNVEEQADQLYGDLIDAGSERD